MDKQTEVEFVVAMLADRGFHGKAIAGKVSTFAGVTISAGTVYRVCKKHDIKLRDYRDGVGIVAGSVFTLVEKQYARKFRSR
jgi:hypothetical protein